MVEDTRRGIFREIRSLLYRRLGYYCSCMDSDRRPPAGRTTPRPVGRSDRNLYVQIKHEGKFSFHYYYKQNFIPSGGLKTGILAVL